jgi:hypothetical protein
LLSGSVDTLGIGGLVSCFQEPILLSFPDGDLIHYYSLNISILPEAPSRYQPPSLLGRDILDRWRIHYCRPENRLDCQVISSDYQMTSPDAAP